VIGRYTHFYLQKQGAVPRDNSRLFVASEDLQDRRASSCQFASRFTITAQAGRRHLGVLVRFQTCRAAACRRSPPHFGWAWTCLSGLGLVENKRRLRTKYKANGDPLSRFKRFLNMQFIINILQELSFVITEVFCSSRLPTFGQQPQPQRRSHIKAKARSAKTLIQAALSSNSCNSR